MLRKPDTDGIINKFVIVFAPPGRGLASPSSASLRFVAEFIPQSRAGATLVMVKNIFTMTAKSAPYHPSVAEGLPKAMRQNSSLPITQSGSSLKLATG